MFTGIVEGTAVLRELSETKSGGRLVLGEVEFADDLAIGESLAVNGCCLTVTDRAPLEQQAHFDLLSETLRVTNLGRLRPGALVNLERALRAGDRLSGHYVQGHVDCVSPILDFSPHGQDHRLEVALPREFSALVVPRGSIAVDGISLTIAELKQESLVCWIIPHTARTTRLRAIQAGDAVNLEFDLLAKYAHRALDMISSRVSEDSSVAGR